MRTKENVRAPYGGTAWGVALLVMTTIATSMPSPEASANGVTHEITFLNRCKQQVWLAALGSDDVVPGNWALAPTCNQNNAATLCPSGVCDTGSCTCTSNADCTFGSTADTTASCDTVSNRCIRSTKIEVDPGWSGRFWPRTGCSGTDTSFVCETGQCGPPGGGNIDCTVQNASANVATLFELASAAENGADNFDVSLVSGYNLPVVVKVKLPAATQRWEASTAFAAGAQIIENVGGENFAFTNGGSSGTSGSTRPAFPGTWTASVADGADINWVNTGPVCETSGCTRGRITEAQCPSALEVKSGDKYIGCDAPANACVDVNSGCNAGLDYYQCQVNEGTKDLFNETLTLQSPNAATFVCFSADDCPHGTSCTLNPEFADGYAMANGAGLCLPVAQNGGCTPSDNGQPCPAINYPFVGYECHTLANPPMEGGAQVCVPPKTRGKGELWWNAANWTQAPLPTPTPMGTPSGTPGPTASPSTCALDSDCGSGQRCLTDVDHGGLEQCPPGGDCSCWSPQTCTAATCPGANQCLNQHGVPDGKMDGSSVVDCTTETCYCGPQGIYSGTCGPTNAKWTQATRQISEPGAQWPKTFKQSCPVAYSYQFDDPSSNWSCTNYGGLNDYRVVFCGGLVAE